MHNRIKALIVAAMVITNAVSPTLRVLANEIEVEKVSEEIVTDVIEEEKTEEDLTSDIDESEGFIKGEETDKKENIEESIIKNETNVLKESSNSVTKGIKKIEVKANQGSFDWGYGTSNEVAIYVEFDNIIDKKVLEIELEEGMAFDKYPVIGSPSNEIEYVGTKEDKAIITNVIEKPNKDTITNQYSGKLSYEINSSTKVANIVIKVSVDRYKYYGTKEIQDAIKVTVKENDIEQGSTSVNVQAVNNKLGKKNNSLNTSITGRTIQAQRGNKGTTYGYFRNTTSKVETDNNGIMSFTYIKNAILTMYYPEHTSFVGVNNLPSSAIVENNELENKVIITMPNPTITNFNVSLTYKVDDNAPYEIIESKNKNTMEVEYYDGTKETLIADKSDSVQVVDPNTLSSIIEMNVLDGYYHDYNGNSLSIGGYIYLDKSTLIDYTDQVFEYNFLNWNTRKVLLPYDMTDIIDIKYTLIGDNKEYSININQLAPFGGDNRLIDADKLGLSKNQYFEKVTFEVKSISKDFAYTDKGRHNKYAISFGELPNGVNKGSTTVKIYSKEDSTVKREISREITRVDNPEKIAITSWGASVTEKSGDSTTDKSYKAKTIFDANKGFTREKDLSHYLENPEVIIRMPKGFNLSKTSIKLVQNKVEKSFTITEHISTVDGATIYTLNTSDVKIGGFDPITLEVNPGLSIEFDFDVDSNIGGEFNINEIIFIGKKGSNIDRYYGSADIVITNDNLGLIPGENRSLGRSESVTFDIIKTSDLIITTHVRDNGSDIDKNPYDKDDENTAIQITKDSLIDFVVRIENNTLKARKEFEVYIPIPKQGLNMGQEVQSEEFTWDMELNGVVKLLAKDKDGNAIDANDLFEISYGLTEGGNTLYSSYYSPDKDVIKIIAKNDIEPGVIGEVKFTFKAVNDIKQEYVGSLNVFNTIYTKKYDSGSRVVLKGNSVGFKLSTGQVKGIAFSDNDRDGLCNIPIDTPLKDIEVQLWNKTTNSLVSTAVTDENGEYKFEGLSKGDYEVKVINNDGTLNPNTDGAKRFTKLTTISGDSYKNDSDILSTDNINGSISINIPTKSQIKDINNYVNIGFVEPVSISVQTNGNGTVSGENSGDYKVWPSAEIQAPTIITPDKGYKFVNYTIGDTEEVFNFPSEVNSDITIKANFEKIIYKVTLNSNEGTNGTVLEKEIAFNEFIKKELDLLTDEELPSRDEYKLIGWSKTKDKLDLITDTDRMGASPITLYAIWDKAPEIIGATDIDIKVGSNFDRLLGVEVKDNEDGIIASNSIVISGELKIDKPGKYILIYTVNDAAGNVTSVKRVVTVYGEPTITGANDTEIKLGSTFNPLDGVEAKDTEGNDLKITVVGDIDENKLGEQKITYTVEDKAGNIKTVERVVTVYGEPTITGANDTEIKLGSTFDPLDGVSAKDTEGEELNISVSGDIVDVNKPGKYTVIYTVTDKVGNVTIINRIVTIEAIESTVIPDNSINKEEVKEEEKTDINLPINSNRPNTGDKGILSYLLLALSSIIGLTKIKKEKK